MVTLPPSAPGGVDHIEGKSDRVTDRIRLAVQRVSVVNFRSYPSAELETSGRPVVLAGPNGAGKTNLLDALSLLSPGRGLRGAKLSEHTRKGPSVSGPTQWAIAARVSRGGECYEIGTGLAQAPGGSERRLVRLNGAPAQNSAELGEVVQMLWLTPTMDRLFTEGASGRRRFLDRLSLGFRPDHARSSLRYETATRERARLLKFGPRDPAWLDGLEAEMAETGIAIAAARAQTIERLNSSLNDRSRAGAFPAALLSLTGQTDDLVSELDQERARDALRACLCTARMHDAESGRTSAGPHTSDLSVRHMQKRADARECSTGEQKALLISIVLADARELAGVRDGMSPILLLDEIAAHLDATRRSALFEEIVALGSQAWMTGTDEQLFSDLRDRADTFVVNDGRFLQRE